MKANMGSSDRIIRAIAALTLGTLYFTNVISGTTAIILALLGIILLLTSLVSFCPLYAPFKFSTKKADKV